MFNSLISTGITPTAFILCTLISLALGLLISVVFSIRAQFSPGFSITIAILPAIVQVIIMMVSGSIGAGVAVAGTFSLVRFRSEPGTARQICAVFLAVAVGIALGMGYAAIAAIFFVVVAAFYLILTLTGYASKTTSQRSLRITIPENLNYDGLFDDLFAAYTTAHTLSRVRTKNMGTLYELTYTIRLKNDSVLKEFLDGIRTRNGNLDIICNILGDESDL